MVNKTGISLVDESPGRKKKPAKGGKCPVCGSPGGKFGCESCGWGMEELGPDFRDSLKDPVSTIMHARLSYSDMKKENAELKKKTESLLFNNSRFSELVEAMENDIKILKTEAGKKYVYSYGMGGWRRIDDIDRTKLRLKTKGVTVSDINNQLREILRLLRKYEK